MKSKRFAEMARGIGLTVVEQPTQYKIHGADASKKMYVPKRKEGAPRVELSGFRHERAIDWSTAYPQKAPPSKRVFQVLDLSQDEAGVAADFELVAGSLA